MTFARLRVFSDVIFPGTQIRRDRVRTRVYFSIRTRRLGLLPRPHQVTCLQNRDSTCDVRPWQTMADYGRLSLKEGLLLPGLYVEMKYQYT